MASLNILKLDDFSEMVKTLKNPELSTITFEELKKLPNLQNFSALKDSLAILTVISDLEDQEDENSEASLQTLKEACKKIQNSLVSPILDELVQVHEGHEDPDARKKEIQAKFLSKWWVSYLSLLDESFHVKQEKWGSNLDEWVTIEELGLLKQTLLKLEHFYHWKIVLLKAILQKTEILSKFLDSQQEQNYFDQIKSVLQENVENGIQNAKLSTKNNASIEFRINLLQNLLSYLTSSPKELQKTLSS